MKFEFVCEICNKQVRRGDKFSVTLDQYENNRVLGGVVYDDSICHSCAGKIERKIKSMRRAAL